MDKLSLVTKVLGALAAMAAVACCIAAVVMAADALLINVPVLGCVSAAVCAFCAWAYAKLGVIRQKFFYQVWWKHVHVHAHVHAHVHVHVHVRKYRACTWALIMSCDLCLA